MVTNQLKQALKEAPAILRERLEEAMRQLDKEMPEAHSAEVLCSRMTW